MRFAALAAALVSTAALAAGGADFEQVRDVRMFERVRLGPDVSVVAFGVMEDSRCTDPILCFEGDRLVIDTVLAWRGKEREVPLQLGVPHRLPGGTVLLAGTATPPNRQGATRLGEYRLDFVYYPAHHGR